MFEENRIVPIGNAVKLSPKGLNLNNLRCKPEVQMAKNDEPCKGSTPYGADFTAIGHTIPIHQEVITEPSAKRF
jgi:hypothetical protein